MKNPLLPILLACALFCMHPNFVFCYERSDEAAVQSRTARICDALVRADAETILNSVALEWGDSSKKEFRTRIESGDLYSPKISGCRAVSASVNGEGAEVRVKWDRIDGKQQPVNGYGLNHQYFYLAKQAGEWRLKNITSAENVLIGKLLATDKMLERQALIKSEPELNTHRVMFVIIFRLQTEGRFEMTEEFFQLADWYKETFYKGTNEASYVNTILNVLNARASNSTAKGELVDALRLYVEANEVAREYQTRTGKTVAGAALAPVNVGRMYFRLGDLDQAERFGLDTLKMLEGADKLRQAVLFSATYTLLADVYTEKGQYARALEFYRMAETEERFGSSAVQMKLRNYADAEQFYQRFLGLADRSTGLGGGISTANIVQASIGMAEIRLLQNSHDEALAFAKRARATAAGLRSPELVFSAATTEGIVLERLGRLPEAEKAFLEAIEAVEAGREKVAGTDDLKIGYLETRTRPYEELVDLSVKQGKQWQALSYAERLKARVLNDALGTEKVDFKVFLSESDRKTEAALRQKLIDLGRALIVEKNQPSVDRAKVSNIEKELQRLRLEYSFLETSFYSTYPQIQRSKGTGKPLSIEEVATLFDEPGHILLEYARTSDSILLFVVSKSAAKVDVEVVSLDESPDKIDSRIDIFRDLISKRDLKYISESRRLYDLLLGTGSEKVRTASRLTIVADGKLWQLPFAALANSSGKFLIENKRLDFAPSLTALRELKKIKVERPTAKNELLALGNPVASEKAGTLRPRVASLRSELGELPEAEAEVAHIGRLYGQKSKVLTRIAASEELWKSEAAGYRTLHLATHGVTNDRRPLNSYLFLAPDSNKEDGILEAREIMNHKLSADLAILSACDTGGGRSSNGEGIVGLSWAFGVAGVPRVIASQWKVESKATADLMISFHRQYRSKGSSRPADALRSAMLEQLRRPDRRHPFYWSPFISIGLN